MRLRSAPPKRAAARRRVMGGALDVAALGPTERSFVGWRCRGCNAPRHLPMRRSGPWQTERRQHGRRWSDRAPAAIVGVATHRPPHGSKRVSHVRSRRRHPGGAGGDRRNRPSRWSTSYSARSSPVGICRKARCGSRSAHGARRTSAGLDAASLGGGTAAQVPLRQCLRGGHSFRQCHRRHLSPEVFERAVARSGRGVRTWVDLTPEPPCRRLPVSGMREDALSGNAVRQHGGLMSCRWQDITWRRASRRLTAAFPRGKPCLRNHGELYSVEHRHARRQISAVRSTRGAQPRAPDSDEGPHAERRPERRFACRS